MFLLEVKNLADFLAKIKLKCCQFFANSNRCKKDIVGHFICKQGQKNWNTRLTEKDILKIKKLAGNADAKPKGKRVKLGKYTITEIAEMFGISPVHVINIRRRKVWKRI
mgnify:CR=1 FL=1